ncbi:MAG: hypothetical protein WDM96_15395 [Lacunisphaera sp.]
MATTPPTTVVLDFVADASLTMMKTRQAYLLKAADATGSLIVYNFGSAALTGELTLDSAAWTLADDTHVRQLQLAPGERREVLVKIRLADAARFTAQIAKARFVVAPRGTKGGGTEEAKSAAPAGREAGPPGPIAPQVSGSSSQLSPFEVYFADLERQSLPDLAAPARPGGLAVVCRTFRQLHSGFLRPSLPARSAVGQQPVALVFFFRPATYPATYQIRHASVVEFVAPHAAPASGKR